uniref:Thaumatin-like protein 1 n=1 Tax=Populus alba TaxID=43335 RepID=A0A4U5MZS5_POPAL|nr:hypothetical protein D5086_0000290030 [Populus alba]
MSRIILLKHLSSFLVAHLFISGVVSTTFTITNSCNYKVWPGVYSSRTPAFSTTGFSLDKNESRIIKAPASWTGSFWGRTYCTEDSSGNFSCITGDCGSGKLECSGNRGASPVTELEITLGGFNGLDFFDVNLLGGFNLPLLVVPIGQNCSSIGCIDDFNESCPAELEVTNGTEEKSVGCRSACDALKLPIYCCNGRMSSFKCKPSLYSRFFKNSCPQGFTYYFEDNGNITYTCPSTDYQITFCPDEYMQSDKEEIIRMLKVAAWCLQDDPERRPLMSTVEKVLEGVMEVGSNLVYKFSHALAPPPAVGAHISSAPPPASVLSNPR